MGILDKIFGKSERKNKEDKLVLFVNLFMNLAGADGERSKEEGDYIIDYVSRYSSEITKEKWMEIVLKAESLGDNAMEMAIELDQNEKIKLVEELIGLAGSDGHFHGAEFSWIMVFSETIGLDSKIVQDEILKNHEIDMDEFNKSLREFENRLEDNIGEKIDLTESENLTDTKDNQEEYLNNSRKVNTKLLYDLREDYYKLYDNNNYSEAIKKLTQIIEQIPVLNGQSLIAYTDPSDILNGILLEEIYFNRSQLYSQLNLIDDAKNDLIKAVNSNPGRKEPIIHHHLGCTMIQCGDFTSCIEHFNIAIDEDSEYYDSYYMRAVAYSSDESELTDINKAIDDLKKYLEHDPNDNAANNLLNILQQNSNT